MKFWLTALPRLLQTLRSAYPVELELELLKFVAMQNSYLIPVLLDTSFRPVWKRLV